MLSVVHVPYTYFPDPVGGTEIYVEQLVRGLSSVGIRNIVAAPGTNTADYEHDGIPVHRLAVSDTIRDLSEIYGEGDRATADEFGAWLDTVRPDVVHLHAFTRIVSVEMVRAIQACQVPVVFTYHTPTVSCLRSGLMLWGKYACDGVLNADRCARCRLHSLGMPKSMATLVARTPDFASAAGYGRSGPIWTALRMHSLVARQHAAIRELMARVDCVVALCDWTHRVLRANDVPADKIVVLPHGLDPVPAGVEHTRGHRKDGPLRIVALGRLEPIKGLDILVRAFKQLRQVPITLDIFGIQQSTTDTVYARHLRRQIARDPRIRLLPPVENTQIVELLKDYDVLAAPSQWFETGPLVVLEAFSAGVPVLGANLGGIAEKVEDGVNGLLVDSFDEGGWRDAIERLANDRALLERLRSNVRPPRRMAEVVAEMLGVYERVMAAHPRSPSAVCA